jgi:ABC-type Fe3+/spermidine/putrescine transport system ATPase subunit
VTHDQEEALTMSDRIAVMKDGIIQQIGNPVSLYEEPANRFVADFIGESNFIDGIFEGMEQEMAVIRIGEERIYAMTGREEPAQNTATTITVRPERMAISSLGEREGPGITGTIMEVVYIGTDIRYLLRIASGQEIQVRIQNSSKKDINAFPDGAEVQIGWAPEDAKLLSG